MLTAAMRRAMVVVVNCILKAAGDDLFERRSIVEDG